MSLKVKLCGLNDKESILAAHAADFIGFVFYQKSPRFISAMQAKQLKSFIKPKQKIVGLFVNADFNLVSYVADSLNLDLIQLHGTEDLDYIKEIKKFNKPIIKAVPIKNYSDIENAEKYSNVCDMILFDTMTKDGTSGGSGKKFDWNLMKNYDSKKEWILAGGLNINNIGEALKTTNAPVLDISSGIEKSRGKKCTEKISEILKFIKQYDSKN